MDPVPPVFVLMGDFCSSDQSGPEANYPAYRQGFTQLARLLREFPRLREGSQFVFVPGPRDPGMPCGTLPRMPLPESLTADVRQVSALEGVHLSAAWGRLQAGAHLPAVTTPLPCALHVRCCPGPCSRATPAASGSWTGSWCSSGRTCFCSCAAGASSTRSRRPMPRWARGGAGLPLPLHPEGVYLSEAQSCRTPLKGLLTASRLLAQESFDQLVTTVLQQSHLVPLPLPVQQARLRDRGFFAG